MKAQNMKLDNLNQFCSTVGLVVSTRNNPNGVGSMYEFYISDSKELIISVIGYRDALNFAKGFRSATKILSTCHCKK